MRAGRILVFLAILALCIAALGAALSPSASAPPTPCNGATVILNGQEQCVDLNSG